MKRGPRKRNKETALQVNPFLYNRFICLCGDELEFPTEGSRLGHMRREPILLYVFDLLGLEGCIKSTHHRNDSLKAADLLTRLKLMFFMFHFGGAFP